MAYTEWVGGHPSWGGAPPPPSHLHAVVPAVLRGSACAAVDPQGGGGHGHGLREGRWEAAACAVNVGGDPWGAPPPAPAWAAHGGTPPVSVTPVGHTAQGRVALQHRPVRTWRWEGATTGGRWEAPEFAFEGPAPAALVIARPDDLGVGAVGPPAQAVDVGGHAPAVRTGLAGHQTWATPGGPPAGVTPSRVTRDAHGRLKAHFPTGCLGSHLRSFCEGGAHYSHLAPEAAAWAADTFDDWFFRFAPQQHTHGLLRH